jgi:predicted nuclease with RNAse H fold
MNDDDLIAHVGDLLWTVRECLRQKNLGGTFSTAYAALLAVDVDQIDRIVAAKAADLYSPVTHESANKYVRKMDDDAIRYELRIVAPMGEQTFKKIRKRSISKLARMARRNNHIAAVSRPSDLKRQWNVVFDYVDRTLANFTRRGSNGRFNKSVFKIDGLFVLIRNSHSDIEEVIKYRNSVALSAGILS